MTNGEKLQSIFPNIIKYGNILIDDTGALQKNILFDDSWWNAEYKEPTNTIDYRRAFKIACDLLNGDILYGVDTDKIYELMMQKDEVVSSSSYEEYILNHLQELDQGQYLTENCIACKYDEIEESDGEHCKKCLAGNRQFELDKEFVQPTIKNDLAHNLCDSCTNIGCVFQSGIVRTECAFYMSPHIEPDNCGNYVVQDSTTKNDLALIRTEGLDEEIRCTMCTNSMKSDRGCDGSCVVDKDMYKAVMDTIEKRIQPTTKNNLGVDCIDRQATLDAIIKRLGIKNEKYLLEAERAIYQQILAMPSIIPQLSSELEKNSKKLEKDFGELNCIDKAELLKAMDTWDKFGNDPNEGLIPLKTPALQDRYVPYVKYYDMVNCVKGMSSVTTQEPRWIPINERLPEEHLCNDGYIEPSDYVLVQMKSGLMHVTRYWGNRQCMAYEDWLDLHYPTTDEVIAWMPLPKLYEPQESEEEE